MPLRRKYCSRHCGATIADNTDRAAHAARILITSLQHKHCGNCDRAAPVARTPIALPAAQILLAPLPRSSQLRCICGADTAHVTAVRPLRMSQTRCPRGVVTTCAFVAWQSRRSRLCLLLRSGYCLLHCGTTITEIAITRAPAARPLLAPLPRSHHGDYNCAITVARPSHNCDGTIICGNYCDVQRL